MRISAVLPAFFCAVLTSTRSSHTAAGACCAPSSGFFTIQIAPVPDSNIGPALPPTVVHQQHVNRGIRRLERMMGRSKTPDHVLLSKIQKRASALPPSRWKRYYQAKMFHHSDIEGSNQNEVDTLETGPDAEFYDGEVDKMTKAHQASFSDSVGLDVQGKDSGYIGAVQIGTPPRTFSLLMDSGSADAWVGGEECTGGPEGEGCGRHTFLGPKSSSSFNDTGRRWSIEYGSGAVLGHIVTDLVVFAGLQVQNFTFGTASKESDDFIIAPFDGLVGLARSSISRQKVPTLVESLFEQGRIPAPIVAFKISRVADGKNDGEMTFGAMDPAKYDANSLVTIPNINSKGFWEGAINRVAVNDIDMGWPDRTAIFDTGTTLFLAPEDDVKKIHEAIPDAVFNSDTDAWLLPCNTTAKFVLCLGGREFPVDSRDLAFLPLDPHDPNGYCLSGISSGSPDTVWLLGDVFLKNVYFATNAQNNSMSFAQQA